MSITRVIAELIVTGVKVFGKASAAAGAQAVRNFKHKPDGAPSDAAVGTGGSSKSQITNQLNMSLDEALLILNVKKEDPLEIIQKSYDRIFQANSPPTTPAPTTSTSTPAAAPQTAAARAAARREAKIPTHSHYLQSKVYRALERIKAEKEAAGGGAAKSESGGAEGGEAAAPSAPPPPPPTGTGTGTGSS